jgi:hypothetical protein
VYVEDQNGDLSPAYVYSFDGRDVVLIGRQSPIVIRGVVQNGKGTPVLVTRVHRAKD